MQPESLELELKSQVPVSQSVLHKLKINSPNVSGNASIEADCLGGVLRDGKLAWFAVGSNIEIFSLKTGQRVAGQSFDRKTVVTCVAEVTANELNSCMLIIAVQRSPVGGLLYLFSVQGSRIVHRIDVIDKITSCYFICDAACSRGSLRAFNGCAAVGTETGEVFLIDLNLNRCKEIISRQIPYNSDDSTCKILSAPIDHDEVRFHVKKSRTENINLGIRLDTSVIEQPSAITAILSMSQMQMIVVGFENGILALFNLSDLNALHLAYPPEIDSPLMKLTFLEPADDPRPCVYIWAFHANESNFPFAVMHAVTFSSKTYQDGENVYETFQWCRPDLTIPIYEKESTPISCQSVTKIITEEEDEQYSLCLLAWTNRISSFVLVFDLNQWYKEQMPRVCDWRDYPSYLAPFPIQIVDTPLDIWLNPKSVVTFNSIQRPEEHFYPTSLSVGLIEITATTIYNLHWAGLQNNAIKKLSSTGAAAILVPDECFSEFLEASLIPQLSDQNYHANPSKKMKQEFLLSMALEYNCMSLLRECAHRWADGSHMGRVSSDSLTLSTMTEWIWNQATLIKDRCNDLCMSLFDDSGITIDLRSRKILAHYSRQLKLLTDLLHLIITNYRQYIPDEIFDKLTAQRNSIRMTSEYQEVLQWLLNMGLLPEIVWNQTTLPEIKNDTITATPYPYRILNDFYTEQRQRFYDIDRNNIAPKTNSCRCLYIDSFIDRECNSHLLRNEWSNGLGDGLYPPPSLQAMLRILLVPGISLENKYMLFVYLFLDLHNFLEGEHFDVVQNLIKFPAVFKLNSSLIKTTQAFWNLDHNEYEIALRELISPLTSDRFITQWQQELLVNTLLIRDMPHLALQAVRAPGPAINTSLRIKTLLANNLITEAFELQRSKCDENLLIEFFKGCHEQKKWNHVLHLALTEREGEVLCKFLRTCDTLLSENLHLLYLLQRNKYIEAITYLDETRHKPRSMLMQRKLENTQDLIMSSYKLAMNSTNRTLCDQYMTIKNRLHDDVQQNCVVSKPLSSELNPFIVDVNANVVGSVFHRAMISAKKTGFSTTPNKSHIPLLGSIRIDIDFDENVEQKPISQPKPYIGQLKRRKEIAYEHHADSDVKQPAAKRQRIDSFSIADVEPKRHAPGINSYLLSSLTNQSHIFGKRMQSQMDDDDDDMDETVAVESADQGQRNSLGELCDTVNLLSTPVVKSGRLEKHNLVDSRCHTPQSILKQRHTDVGSSMSRRSLSPSLTVNSAKRSVDFNAKSFCYTIPSQNDEYRLDAIQETINIQRNEDDDSSSVNTSSSIKGRRPIHSGKNSTSNSVDEYYSPETSKVLSESSMVQEMEHNDLSRIMPQSNMPTPTTQSSYPVSPRRKLRSKTPEVTPTMSSTRITRSRSKLNLDDTAGDQENSTKPQPVLNTSTPKRTSPQRSPSRFLSKNVITSNALKIQSETDQLQTKLLEPQSASQPDDNDSVDATVGAKQRNLLKDASEISFRHRSMYAMDSTDEGDATQPKRNLLQDSSAFTSVYSIDSSQSKSNLQMDASMDVAVTSKEQSAEQEIEEKEVDAESIHEKSIIIDETTEAEAEAEADTVNEPIETHTELRIPIESKASVENPNRTVEDNNVIEITVTEETSVTVTERLPTNYLVDSSAVVSDSIIQKFSRYDHYTSSFFSETQRPQENLLEDSSQCGPLILYESESDKDDQDQIFDVDDLDSKSGKSENDSISIESQSESESESENEMEEEDEEEAAPEEEEEANGDMPINEKQEEEIINISSSSNSSDSSSSSEAERIDSSTSDDNDDDFGGSTVPQRNYNIYGFEYDMNDEIQTLPTISRPSDNQYEDVTDYNLTELQAAPIQLDIPSQEQAMNEMIYGDLNVADAEMLNLDVHNDAVGFEMHSDREEVLGDHLSIHTNVVEIPNTVTQQLVLDDTVNVEPVQQTISTAAPQHDTIALESADGRRENTESANVNDEVTSTNVEMSTESHANTNIDEIPNADSQNLVSDDIAFIAEPVEQSGSTEAPNQEIIAFELADDGTKNPERDDTMDTSNIDEAVNANVEVIAAADENRDTANIQVQKKETINESNVLDQAMIIDDTEIVAEQEIPQSESVGVESKRMDEEEAPKVSVEVIAAADENRGTANIQVQKEETINESNVLDQAMIIDDTAIVAEQEISQSESVGVEPKKMDEGKASNVMNEAEPAEVELRTTRAKSQQPPAIETSNMTSENSKPSTSVARDFTIKLRRSEIQEHQAAHKKVAPSVSSESKKLTTKPKKSEDEQVQTKQTNESLRKKRGNSQNREQSMKTKGDEVPTTSKATIPKRQRTKSTADSDLGEKFDAEESVQSRRLRKAVSHQSLSEIPESMDEVMSPKKSRAPRKTAPRRALSQQSLSSTSDSDGKHGKETTQRVTRSKSIQSFESDATSTSRTKRATSKQPSDDIDSQREPKTLKRKKVNSESSDSELGDKFDADESTRTRRLRKAVSHQTLSKIDETSEETSSPKKVRTPRKAVPRRALSQQSLSNTSDDENKPSEEPAQRVTRSKSIQSIESDATSTKSRSKRATSKQPSDDNSSQKETKTAKRKKDNSVLPSIPEDDKNQSRSILPAEYLESSRLTRSQRATIEKYSKLKENVTDTQTIAKRSTRKAKADTESSKSTMSDHSDTESVASQKSSTSKMSKKSKTSEASSSQRSTRQRTQQKK